MSEAKNEVRISLRIQPGAPKNEVVGFAGGVWKIKIAAPPVEGRANQELIRYLSEILDVAKSQVTIVKGEKGRNKVISVSGLAADEISARLAVKTRL